MTRRYDQLTGASDAARLALLHLAHLTGHDVDRARVLIREAHVLLETEAQCEREIGAVEAWARD